MTHSGSFLVFEGVEGSGKSTQIRLLVERLHARGREPLVTREPGGTRMGAGVREVLLEPDFTINPLAEFLLLSADRAQHVEEVVRPALAAGWLVISDRFAGASVAYQGYGRGLELDFVRSLTERVTHTLTPDLTLLLDIDPERGLERVAARGHKDRLERADLSFHRRVREGFLAQADNPKWVVLDATRSPDTLSSAVWRTVSERLPL